MDDYGGPPQNQPFLKDPAFRWGMFITGVPMVFTSVISVAFKMPSIFLVGAIFWFPAIVVAAFLSATGHGQAAEGVGAGFLIGSVALGASFLVVAGAFG